MSELVSSNANEEWDGSYEDEIVCKLRNVADWAWVKLQTVKRVGRAVTRIVR